MRVPVVLAAVIAVGLLPGAAGGASTLSSGTAERAVTHRLERYQAFREAHATCHRRTRREQGCTWRGRRAGAAWRGTARVRRLAGGGLDVRITSARRV